MKLRTYDMIVEWIVKPYILLEYALKQISLISCIKVQIVFKGIVVKLWGHCF